MRAIVIGRNYTSRLGMIRAAGLAGCDVFVINTEKKAETSSTVFDYSSKYVRKTFAAPEPDEERLVKTILGQCPDGNEKAVLLPTDDYAAAVIDRNQERLRESFLFPNAEGKTGEAVRLMDKDVQKKLAEESGLNAAKGWSLTFDGGGFSIPEDMIYPCFVKAQTSFRGSKFYMRKCGSAAELQKHLEEVAQDLKKRGQSAELLIEQFIEIEKEYDIPGFTNGEEAVIPLFIEKGVIHLGVTGTGKLVDSDDFPDLKEKLETFIKKLKFTGLVDIELYESRGQIYFNELNMRFGATGFAMTGTGINMPGMLIRTLKNEEPAIRYDKAGAVGKRFASEKVIYQEFRDDKISWKEYQSCIDGADFNFIRNADDPGPYREFDAFIRKFKMKKTIKGFLHRK